MSDKQIRNNQRYNAERKAQAELMKRDLDRDKMLAQIYQESFDRMQREIDGFYMRYASKEGLTKQEAMKRVSEMDVTKFNAKAAKAVKEKDFSHATNEWLKVYNLKMKVSRLELLKAELTLEIQNLTAEVNEVFDKARADEYLNEYKRQAGILGISSSGAKRRMQAILDADFYGQNFSARVWGDLGLRAALQREVFGSLNRIFTDMMGYKQEMKRLAKKYGTSEQNAKRLLKTEIARINADTQYSMLRDNGFTHMIFVAEPGACDLCGPLDKVAIPIDKVEKGVNMYPMHPNCRCSAYGHIKMEYKAGGSTLDREAPNGVWGEDSSNTPNQKQVNGEQRKRIVFNPKEKPIPKPKKQSSVKSGHLFTNHTEAEQYAMSNGVQYANFSKMKPEWYNAILDNLDKLPEETRPVVLTDTKTLQQLSGIKMGRNAKSYYGVSQYMSGHFEKVNGELTQFRDGTWVGFNTVSYKTLKSVEKAKNDTEQLYFDKFGKKWSQLKTAEETIAHEFGHLLDNHKNASDNWEWKNIAKQWHEESNFDHLKSPSEAWADAVGLKWNKKDVPSYVEEYMKKYATDNFDNKSLFEITNS